MPENSAQNPAEAAFVPRRDVDAYFIARGDGWYDPTLNVQGAWNDNEQHLACPIGLIVHAIDRHEPRENMQLSRVTFEVYGQIPLRPSHVSVRTVRPGRTIELIEATFTVDGRTIIVAHAWRLSVQDSSPVAGSDAPTLPAFEEVPEFDMSSVWPGRFIETVSQRRMPDAVPGRSRNWVSTEIRLIDGEEYSDHAAFLGLIDTANGVSVRVDPREWMFPNVELSLHLFRQPVAGPTGLDTTVSMGTTGLGVTHSVLSDIEGPVGYVTQSLTVRDLQPKS